MLDLLVTDSLLPGSVRHALDGAAAELAAIGPGPHAAASSSVQRLAKRLGSLVHYEWPDREDRAERLLQIDAGCRNLHQLVVDAYFDYPTEGLAGPRR